MSGIEKFEIQIGEHGAETCVGIRPPLPDDHLTQVIANLSPSGVPAEITPAKTRDDEVYTLLKFMHPHFGKFRNVHALDAVEAIRNALTRSGNSAKFDENIRDLSGDNKLFD